uniref:Ubiquitin-like domain-containing protein n=1 Tax=Panagrellus redivivus TaxID=6233 RepID=A0A7E4VQF4_PANRE
MMIFIKFTSGTAITVDVEEHDTVERLYHEARAQRSLGEFKLTVNGQQLELSKPLSAYNIDEGTVIHAD